MNTNNLIESFVTKGVSKSVHNAENTSRDFTKMTKVFTLRQGYHAGKQCTFMYLVNAYSNSGHETVFLSGKVILSASGSRIIKVSNRCNIATFHFSILDNGDIDIYLRLDDPTGIVMIQEVMTTSTNIQIEKENKFVDVSSLNLSLIAPEKNLTWATLTLESGITAHDNFISLWKDYNTVHLRTYLKGTLTQGMKIATLPETHRPRDYQEIITICKKDNDYLGTGVVSIDSSGNIKAQSFPSGTNILNITAVYLSSKMVI